jgi:acyl-CoA dehydrogenase
MTTTESSSSAAALTNAQRIAPTIRAHARAVDEEGKFPDAAFEAIRASGLLGLVVPRGYGGLGCDWTSLSAVARIFGAECLSTALIWAMHSQQVAILVDHGSDDLKERVLPRVAAGEVLLASVTSEEGKGGHVLTALAPLRRVNGQVLIERAAPSVTAGSHADAFLITMRNSETSPPSDVALVYAERSQLTAAVTGGWYAMGMRGSDTVPMMFRGSVAPLNVVAATAAYRRLAVTTMIPVGHIAWSACWLGGATAALQKVVALMRSADRGSSARGQSDLAAARLARARLRIDCVAAYLDCVLREYSTLRDTVALDGAEYDQPEFNVRINTLKVLASEQLFAAADELVQLAGLRSGYVHDSGTGLERTFRDLRAAALMYSNDRLLVANGKLTLVEPLGRRG